MSKAVCLDWRLKCKLGTEDCAAKKNGEYKAYKEYFITPIKGKCGKNGKVYTVTAGTILYHIKIVEIRRILQNEKL